MERSEELNALCGDATGAEPLQSKAATDAALDGALAAMASAMANLMEPTEAAALNEAAAKLMEGGNNGDA